MSLGEEFAFAAWQRWLIPWPQDESRVPALRLHKNHGANCPICLEDWAWTRRRWTA
jgi:hypothetical protein